MNKRMNVLFNFPYRPRYYLTHPHKFLKDIYWNIRNAWHRINDGFAYGDVWNFDSWFLEVAPAMLRHMARQGSAYPGHPPFDTPEQWHDWLEKMASNLENCKEENIEKQNEFEEEFCKLSDIIRREKNDDKFGKVITYNEDNEEFKHIKKLYFARAEQLYKERKEKIEETMSELGAYFCDLWD